MKCPKCGQICRNNRAVCALCGTPLKQKKGYGWLIAVIVILTLILCGLLAWRFLLNGALPLGNEGQPAELVTYDEPEPGEGETPKAAPEPLARTPAKRRCSLRTRRRFTPCRPTPWPSAGTAR